MKWTKIFLLDIVFFIAILASSFVFYNNFKVVNAAQKTITTRLDFDSGLFDGTEDQTKEGDLKLKTDGSWNPMVFKSPKLPLVNQSAIVSDNENIYLLAGYDNYFTKYNSDEDKWVTLTQAPHIAYNGSDLVVLGGYVYAIYGSYTKEFSRYSIINNSWEDVEKLPDLIANGSTLETDGTYIYALRGAGTSDFWRYNPQNNKWTILTSPPATISSGASLVYKDGFLYTARGSSTNTFYKYNITTGVWSTMQNIPATIVSNHNSTLLGNYIYLNRDSNTNSFYRFNIGTTKWETITNLPQTAQYVGAVGVGDSNTGFVYVFRGNTTYDFWKYNPRTNSFMGQADLPNTPGTGADLLYIDNFVYFRRGNNSTSLYRYNTSIGGTWTTAAASPAAFGDETRGVKAGNYLYYLRGSGTTTFYRYDPNTGGGGTWAAMMTTPITINYGAALAYPGSGNYIYATRGGLSRTFIRYTIGVGETWDDVAVADLPDNVEAGYGSRMTSDGTDIYYISGQGMAKIYKYTISNNTWTELNNLPFSPYYGTDMGYYNGRFYFLSGNLKSDYWEYTIATNSWRQLNQIQSYGLTEVGSWNGGSIVSNGNGTFYSELGNNNTRFASYTVGTNNYLTSGIWTSGTQDLGYVNSWSQMGIEANIPNGTEIIWETRTSSNGTDWESWKTGLGTSITSTPNRYIQTRVTLNSDGVQTPILNSININYNGDLTAPTNPTNVSGLSQQVSGIGLTSGETYDYMNPYFDWSGGIDTETGIVGYYIYFGPEADGNPEIDGFFRTNPNYLVSVPMDQLTYYLRIKTVDGAGNKSEAVTLFVYKYDGVSPPATLTQSLTTDFGLGTTENVNISNDQIKLTNKNGFWQQDRLSQLNGTINYGSGFAYSESRNKLYILRGTNTNSFYQYDLTTNIGSTLANAPATVYYGADIVEGPEGYLYATRGYNTNSFWRYDLAANTWSDVLATDTPQPIYFGGSLVFDGDRYIYALKGNSDDTFMRYDTMTDSWEILDNIDFGSPIEQINNTVYNGGDLAFDNEGGIYAIQGNTRTGFAFYNVNSGKWQQLENLPTISNYGSQIEFDPITKAIYYTSGYGKTFFYKYSIEEQKWSQLSDVPYPVNSGAALRRVGDNLYLALGGGSANLYKYNITKNAWTVPTMGLFGGWWRGTDSRAFGYGTDIVRGDGDNYYLTRGNFDNLFSRYNPKTGVVTKMADVPAGFTSGGDLVYDNVHNKIYAMVSPYYRKLFVYDVATDVWTEESNDPPPLDPADGGSMSFDGIRYIYWARGGNTNSFYKFDTQGNSGSKWSLQTNIIATIGAGGDLITKGNFIYALRGIGTTGFLRYNIGTTTWSNTDVTDLPTGMTVSTDGFLIDLNGDKLMACRGQNTNTCYEYSISGNNWTLVNGTVGPYIYRGAAAASDGNNQAFVIPGNGTVNTANNGIYSYISQSNESSFNENGSYISPVHDLNMVYKFANLKVGVSMALNSNLEVYTQTSNDNLEWNDLILVTDKKIIGSDWVYKINSTPGRYLKVKLVLTSGDGIRTGIINDYQINYYQDVNSPSNPTEINVYKNIEKLLPLTSGIWTNSTAPYFEWNSGDDGQNGSGIEGYYAYFGVGETANPQILGVYTTATSFNPSNLVSGLSYFFRLKTKDNADNVTTDVGTTFVYKFDNTSPTNPNTISVDPAGYTATNNFNFNWSEAADVGSGIGSYCYKLGVGGSETCIEGVGITGIEGIEAYQTGTNTFYLKAKDLAGNYAGDYTTASFYYSSVAPGAPKNLNVGESISSVNEFSFSWQAPDLFYGQQSGLKYYYSVNALPTANNTSSTADKTYLSKGAYAKQAGVNTFYVVAKDEAGNIDYNNYASVNFVSDSSAPGIPTLVEIADVSDKESKIWKLSVNWEAPEATGSGGVTYKILRSAIAGSECSDDLSNFEIIEPGQSGSSLVDGSDKKKRLLQQKYYYCVQTCDSTNQCSAPSTTVSLLPDGKWRTPPSLIDDPSVVVKTKSAIVSWSTNRAASSFVKYGKNSGDYGDEVGTSDQLAAHTISLIGLEPGTTYYYKVLWTDEDGNTGESAEQTLTTNPAPLISTVKISDVSLYSTYVDFRIKNTVKAIIQYGETTAYGSTHELTTARDEGDYMIKLEDLKEGTKYHLKIQALDDEGNVFNSDDYTFETLPVPKLLDVKIQQVKGMPTSTLRLLWKSNTVLSSILTYYPVGKPEMARDQIKLTLSKSHEVILYDLFDDTDYILNFKGKDSMGNSAENITKKFKTSADMRAPTISDLRLESIVDGVGEEARAQVVVYWDTDEPATSQIEYGQGTGSDYPNKSQKDSNLTLNHSLTIPELKPSEVYHLRVITEDKMANITVSSDNVVITPKETKSALDLVIENLSKSFGFISNLSGGAK